MIPEVSFFVGSVAQLERKVAAYRELFDVTPWLGVEGTVVASDGDTAWLRTGPRQVVKVGRRLVVVDLASEGTFRLDVARNASLARYTLRAPR